MHNVRYFALITFDSSKDTKIGITIPNLHMRKLRLKEVR